MERQEAALGMGTTLVGAFLTPTALLTCNVGDSRSYLFSDGRLIQLGHYDVADDGINRPGQRRSHAITQALGGSSFPMTIEPRIKVDTPLKSNEVLLLCSDGLTDMVDDEEIGYVLSVALDSTARDLASKTFSAGARDNVSVIVARSSIAWPP